MSQSQSKKGTVETQSVIDSAGKSFKIEPIPIKKNIPPKIETTQR